MKDGFFISESSEVWIVRTYPYAPTGVHEISDVKYATYSYRCSGYALTGRQLKRNVIICMRLHELSHAFITHRIF